ncbi:putative membrane protein [Bacillus sp. 153480037-1]
MLLWKTLRYSCLHFFIVTMLFSISFLSKPNGGKWMIAFLVLICIISFSVEFALYRRTNKQKEEVRRMKNLYFIMFQIAMTLLLFACFQMLMNRSI